MFDVTAVLIDLGFEDWEGDTETLTCPCGYVIEHDGRCPDGCVSPLRVMGMI